LTLLMAIGVALRSWEINAAPLWLDEAYSAYAAAHDWTFLWRIVPLYETHPPFYYSLLHLWTGVFGDSLVALRLLGLAAGIATLALVALAADEAGRWVELERARRQTLILAAVGLGCLSLALVEMTREVRPYPVMILTYAGAIVMLLRLTRRREHDRAIGGAAFALYLLLVEAMLWLHNLGPLYGLALTIALAIGLRRQRLTRRDWLWLTAGHALAALAYLPGLAILHGQAAAWTATTWLQFRLDGLLFDRIMTLYGVPGWGGIASLTLTILAFARLRKSPNGVRLAAIVVTLAVLPVFLAILLSLTIAPVFITRIMTATAVPAIVLLAIGASTPGRYRLVGAAAGLWLAGAMLVADVQARGRGPMQDWYRAADWLTARFSSGDIVFAYPNEGKLPLTYALRDKGLSYPIRAIPRDVPALETQGGWHPTGTRGASALPPEELKGIAQAPATQAIPTIWLLRLGAPTFDAGDVFLKELHRGRFVVRRWRDGPIGIVGLRKLPKPLPAPVRSRR
jgi:mannosyltransferase